eukprot:scaffold616823_cov14-Prasinocladus_malaysianus.AAC.1
MKPSGDYDSSQSSALHSQARHSSTYIAVRSQSIHTVTTISAEHTGKILYTEDLLGKQGGHSRSNELRITATRASGLAFYLVEPLVTSGGGVGRHSSRAAG